MGSAGDPNDFAPIPGRDPPPPTVGGASDPSPRSGVPTTTRDVSARGARIRFVEAGSGPALVLVHGWLSSHIVWMDVLPILARSFRVIVPDLPGFGDSEKPAPDRYAYGFDTFAESLVDLVAGLGLGRVSVCGAGLGGAVALTLAAEHADMVDKLVLAGPLVYEPRVGAMARIAPVPVVGPLVFKQLYGRALFRKHFRDHVYGGAANVPWDRVDELFERFNAPAAREAAFATMMAMLDTRSVVARVPRVATPTLVAWGRDDRRNPVTQGRRLARELRRARFEVFDSGPSPAEQCPTAFAEVAAAFLAEGRAA
jgi:pimeloyl-ACP methyl ester carboxylesterase